MSNAIENFEYKELVCPNCKEKSPTSDWINTETFCEDCGSHSAIECPKCEDRFDHVWGYEMIEEATKETL